MHIASLSIPAYLDPGCAVKCFAWENGALAEQSPLGFDDAVALAERGLLHGVGSHRRLRHVIATCGVDEISQAIKDARPIGGKASIVSAASRTVHNEHIDGAQRSFRAYRHTGGRVFAPLMRRNTA